MVQNLNGRLYFTYGAPKNKNNKLSKHNIKLSLLGILVGIFLLPNLAYLSSITPENIIKLTNQERQTAGLNILASNQLLTQAALTKAQAILESQNFNHNIDDKKFSAWIRDTGYDYSFVGENLAIDFVNSEDIMRAWENSPLHKKNLLSPYYKEIGVAAINGKFQGQDTTIVVQIFGTPSLNNFQPLTTGYDSNYSELNLTIQQIGYQESLLTNSILNKKILPAYQSNITLVKENDFNLQANKFIVQPKLFSITENLLIIFTSLSLIYLLMFIYYYYLYKFNKLVSA